jgi:ABC-type Fe3+ transport system permease subunit
VYFFFSGLANGSVTSFNMALWVAILVTFAGLLWGSHMLRSSGKERLATALLSILAVPSTVAALFFLALLIMKPRWN